MPQDTPSKPIGPKRGPVSSILIKAYERLIKIRGNPREIALGFALGLFIGMSPTMGLQTAIAIFFAALFKWNKLSAAISVWISNPLTAPFLYSMTYVAGAKIIGIANASHTPSPAIGIESFYDMLHKAPDIFWALILGGIVLGLPIALGGYFFAFSAVHKYQEDIKRKLAERKEKRAIKKKRKKNKKRKNR